MCYFLYGAINEGINPVEYSKLESNDIYHFQIGSKNDVIESIDNCNSTFRITNSQCDCQTPLGLHNTGKKQLFDLSILINKLRNVSGVQYIYISKNWLNEKTQTEKILHINDIDMLDFLAKIEDNCLYKIELHKRYY